MTLHLEDGLGENLIYFKQYFSGSINTDVFLIIGLVIGMSIILAIFDNALSHIRMNKLLKESRQRTAQNARDWTERMTRYRG